MTDVDVEEARNRIEMAMELLGDESAPDHTIELQLQHAHARLGGEKDDLYPEVDRQ